MIRDDKYKERSVELENFATAIDEDFPHLIVTGTSVAEIEIYAENCTVITEFNAKQELKYLHERLHCFMNNGTVIEIFSRNMIVIDLDNLKSRCVVDYLKTVVELGRNLDISLILVSKEKTTAKALAKLSKAVNGSTDTKPLH